MRKFFLGAALVAASFGMAQSADAATVMDVDGVSTVLAISDYEGTYNGTMDQIKMRGEDYEPRAASYTLENGILSCDFPQIGSMPGNITIELEVEVDEETGEIETKLSKPPEPLLKPTCGTHQRQTLPSEKACL